MQFTALHLEQLSRLALQVECNKSPVYSSSSSVVTALKLMVMVALERSSPVL
jgi:hypothetical protein